MKIIGRLKLTDEESLLLYFNIPIEVRKYLKPDLTNIQQSTNHLHFFQILNTFLL